MRINNASYEPQDISTSTNQSKRKYEQVQTNGIVKQKKSHSDHNECIKSNLESSNLPQQVSTKVEIPSKLLPKSSQPSLNQLKVEIENKLPIGDYTNISIGFQRTRKNRNLVKKSQKPRHWTTKEDEKLRIAVSEIGECNWKGIAARVGTRNHVQCLQRWKKALKPGLTKGHWSAEEDEIIIKLIYKGCSSWGEMAQYIPGRTSKQCRERWRNHLDPKIRRDAFTLNEDEIILTGHAELGNQWATIARRLHGRTENSVKARFKVLSQQSETNNGYDGIREHNGPASFLLSTSHSPSSKVSKSEQEIDKLNYLKKQEIQFQNMSEEPQGKELCESSYRINPQLIPLELSLPQSNTNENDQASKYVNLPYINNDINHVGAYNSLIPSQLLRPDQQTQISKKNVNQPSQAIWSILPQAQSNSMNTNNNIQLSMYQLPSFINYNQKGTFQEPQNGEMQLPMNIDYNNKIFIEQNGPKLNHFVGNNDQTRQLTKEYQLSAPTTESCLYPQFTLPRLQVPNHQSQCFLFPTTNQISLPNYSKSLNQNMGNQLSSTSFPFQNDAHQFPLLPQTSIRSYGMDQISNFDLNKQIYMNYPLVNNSSLSLLQRQVPLIPPLQSNSLQSQQYTEPLFFQNCIMPNQF